MSTLLVYRSDWATAGRETFIKPTGLGTPPLLHAAAEGQREAVEWFLSDEPLKLYLKYSQSKAAKEDSRIAHLAASPGGFRSAVTKWLGDRSEFNTIFLGPQRGVMPLWAKPIFNFPEG